MTATSKFRVGQVVERRSTIHGYVRYQRGTVVEVADRIRVLWQEYRVATYRGEALEGGEVFKSERKPVRTWNRPEVLTVVSEGATEGDEKPNEEYAPDNYPIRRAWWN
jgi:hypothetical protein